MMYTWLGKWLQVPHNIVPIFMSMDFDEALGDLSVVVHAANYIKIILIKRVIDDSCTALVLAEGIHS